MGATEEAGGAVTRDGLLNQFGQARGQLQRLLEESSPELAEAERQLHELQLMVREVACHLPPANVRMVQEQFGALRARVDDVRERLRPRQRFAFRAGRQRPASGKWQQEGDSTSAQHQAEAKGAVNAALKNTATDATTVGFRDRSGEALELEGVEGKDVELDSLVDCEVSIRSCLATLFARRLRNCRIRCGPVAASVFVEGCEGCTVRVACQQLRVHDTRRCEFLVHIQARSIIEDSTELVFGPYDCVYEGSERDWQASGLNRAGVNNWALVDDFNWLAADRPSPNWRTVGQTAVDVKQ